MADFTMRAGDPEAARRIYAELAEKDPDNREYRLGQVRAALSAEQFLNALEILEDISGEDPQSEELHTLRGQALEGLGRNEEALAAYARAARIDPESADPFWCAARLHMEMGDSTAALQSLEAALEADPRHPATLSNLAELAYRRGDTQRGDELLDRALDGNQFDPRANFIRGWRLQQSGDLAAARDAYRRALRARPEYPGLHYNLATVLLGMRRPDEARAVLVEALELGKDSPEIRLNLGVALAQAGQIPDAVRHWRRGLEMAPAPAIAQQLRANLNQAQQILNRTP
ncbi:MAG: tetratricopeptide repeat protein [Candidatus Eisenbacteria bacterium]|nr:tetratricopeptide repeat protein [Candidatus Eisenbacteria bacterium]